MKIKRDLLLSVVMLTPLVFCPYVVAQELKHDPFKKPDFLQHVSSKKIEVPQKDILVPLQGELRAIINAGPRSMANIDGIIITMGEELEGYRLVGVHDREAVLEKNGHRQILTIDE